ncbi:hypothetical protein, partial [Klebsiella pneumoniae]|uniref:hypothetical protein n=1 Tax=Klebsiella pneumoniae TaxID=573 RepID=UPI00210EFA70
ISVDDFLSLVAPYGWQLAPVRLVPGWQSASAPALLRGIALVELAVLVVIVISRGA